MSDLDLLNQFWKATETEKHLAPYKGLVRRARPYTLDADATDLVTELASGESIKDKIAIYRRLSRLPFEVVWVEFDYMDRFKARQRMGTIQLLESPDDAPTKMGFMLERLTDTEWRCLTVVSYPKEKTQSGRTCDVFGAVFVVSTEGPFEFRSWIRDPGMRDGVKHMNEQHGGMLGWGFGVNQNGQDYNIMPPELMDTVAVDLAPSFEYIINQITRQHYAETTTVKQHTIRMMMESLNEIKGDLRFVCAGLAMLNEVPTTLREVRREGSNRIAGRLKPFMVNRIVSVAIPKTKGRVRKIGAMLRLAERSMRRHEVAGHWKTVVLKGGERERRWIKNYERGDASLGYVHQIREVSRS